LEKETLDLLDIVRILGERPFPMTESIKDYMKEIEIRKKDRLEKEEAEKNKAEEEKNKAEEEKNKAEAEKNKVEGEDIQGKEAKPAEEIETKSVEEKQKKST
jgi:hypothetical protein